MAKKKPTGLFLPILLILLSVALILLTPRLVSRVPETPLQPGAVLGSGDPTPREIVYWLCIFFMVMLAFVGFFELATRLIQRAKGKPEYEVFQEDQTALQRASALSCWMGRHSGNSSGNTSGR